MAPQESNEIAAFKAKMQEAFQRGLWFYSFRQQRLFMAYFLMEFVQRNAFYYEGKDVSNPSARLAALVDAAKESIALCDNNPQKVEEAAEQCRRAACFASECDYKYKNQFKPFELRSSAQWYAIKARDELKALMQRDGMQ